MYQTRSGSAAAAKASGSVGTGNGNRGSGRANGNNVTDPKTAVGPNRVPTSRGPPVGPPVQCPSNKENTNNQNNPKPKTFMIKPQGSTSSSSSTNSKNAPHPQQPPPDSSRDNRPKPIPSTKTSNSKDSRQQNQVAYKSKSTIPVPNPRPRPSIGLGSDDSDSDFEPELESFKIPLPPPKVRGPNGTPPPTLKDFYSSLGIKLSTVRTLSRQYVSEESEAIYWNNFEPPPGGYTQADLDELSQANASSPTTPASSDRSNAFHYRKASQSVERRILRIDERQKNCLEKLSRVLGTGIVCPPGPDRATEIEIADGFEDDFDFGSGFESDEDDFLLLCTTEVEEELAHENQKKKPKLDLKSTATGTAATTSNGARGSAPQVSPDPETPKSTGAHPGVKPRSGNGNRNRAVQPTVMGPPPPRLPVAPKQLKFNPPQVETFGEGFEDEDEDDEFLSQLPL